MSTISRWLDVEVGSDDIELNSLPSNLALVDFQNDSEYKLVVGDLGRAEVTSQVKVPMYLIYTIRQNVHR